jgi:hypothetical protein
MAAPPAGDNNFRGGGCGVSVAGGCFGCCCCCCVCSGLSFLFCSTETGETSHWLGTGVNVSSERVEGVLLSWEMVRW